MSDRQKIRMSLPAGTVLEGRRHSYTIINTTSVSGQSVTASCRREDGECRRLKLYERGGSLTEEVLQALLTVSVKGTVQPEDMGAYAGLLFSVTPEVRARSMEQMPVSPKVLTERVIPQLAYVISRYHNNHILLRDLSPEHILWLEKEQRIAFCGLQNAALLPGRATVTKVPCFGPQSRYAAPETDRYGYSTCSDYFALGVTILSLVRGRGFDDSLTREAFLKKLAGGTVPGIRTEHLRNTPRELYGAEDRILYLVLGLLLPDPGKRWGYGELRCWCSGRLLPLVPKGGRIVYQFTEPFAVGGTECWNVRQTAETLAACREAWTLPTVRRLAEFAGRQCPKYAKALAAYADDPSAGPSGKMFRCIYTLLPSMDRLWWNGSSWPDMETLTASAGQRDSGRAALAQLLRERCLSFFCRVRAGGGDDLSGRALELEQMEQWELEKPGKGVSRCMMRFAGQAQSRAFLVEGKRFVSIRSLLEHYRKAPGTLKRLSSAVLSDASFQAWLWAAGCGQAGEYAERMSITHPDESFFLLMSLCEKQAGDEETRHLARGLFLHYGDPAPVVWLAEHIREYRISSVSHQMLYDTFDRASFPLQDSLDALAERARKLTADYQTFAARTLDNPFGLEHGWIDCMIHGYYPVYESGYFCCVWENGLEVCPAFLKTVGEAPDRAAVQEWLAQAEAKEQKRLNGQLAEYAAGTAPPEVSRESEYRRTVLRNVLYGAGAFAAGVGLMILGAVSIGLVLAVPGCLFAAGTAVWYHTKRERIGFWKREQAGLAQKRAAVVLMMDTAGRRREELGWSMQSAQPVRCRIGLESGQGAENG